MTHQKGVETSPARTTPKDSERTEPVSNSIVPEPPENGNLIVLGDYFKAKFFDDEFGPRVVLYDAYTGAPLLRILNKAVALELLGACQVIRDRIWEF